MKEYTREDLIKICDLALVKEEDWNDRDSYDSQIKVGQLRQLLLCGCEFKVMYDDGNCSTDDETIWLYTYAKDFGYFDYRDNEKLEEHYYIPTLKRIEEVNGKDWY